MLANKVVIIEDDNDVGTYLRDLLSKNHYIVKLLKDGSTAIKQIEQNRPDLVILDLGLPTVGGETVCAEVKNMYPDLPIIILTARAGSSNIVKGLKIGADDYIGKPFESEELLARMQAVLRAYHINGGKLKVDNLELDNRTMEVTRNGKNINLTAQEFRLLEYLMNNKGHVLSRDLILNKIWNNWSEVETRVVDVYIGYLRKKIDAGYKKKLIQSVRGFGYAIKE
jgi:DNA-binding response OmpR family regulator